MTTSAFTGTYPVELPATGLLDRIGPRLWQDACDANPSTLRRNAQETCSLGMSLFDERFFAVSRKNSSLIP